MCGIAAIIPLRDHFSPSYGALSSMVASMRYRGPDAAGIHIEPGLGGLGHARLSVIDTSLAANQPFEKQSCFVAFNGEIFNYLELRSELEGKGYHFETDSDTEVLLTSYIEWGENCVERFNGMWAFVIIDRARKRIFCSRDRFGIKPLLYAKTTDCIYIASEAKAIIVADQKFKRPNFQALSMLLRASIGGQNPETCFQGIMRLAPAHNMTIEGGAVTQLRFWDYPAFEDNDMPHSLDEAAEQFAFLLKDAVSLRMRSDVPVGFTLSGGLDSAGIVSVADSDGPKLRTYTACFEHRSYRPDESEAAREVARRAGVENIAVNIGASDLLPCMRQSVVHLEAPHAAVPILPYWMIMDRAKQDITVVLEGQGADELLGGYPAHTTWPAIADSISGLRLRSLIQQVFFVLNGSYGVSAISLAMQQIRTHLPQLHPLYRRYRGDEGVYVNELARNKQDFLQGRAGRAESDRINRVLRESHENGLVNLLQYSDAIPMAHSIESRLPFMDYRIVEFACRLSGRLKVDGGWSKLVLRKSLEHVVPTKIVWNKVKRGFDSPVGLWFRDHLETTVLPVLGSRSFIERGIMDHKRCHKLLKAHQQGKRDLESQIFRWIMTELWFQEFVD